MAIIGVFTDIGISKFRQAQNGEGFRIFPESFSVSEEISQNFPTIESLKGLTEVNSGVFFSGPIASRTTVDSNEKQSINFSAVPTEGVFRLRFENQTTGELSFDAEAVDVQNALNSLPNISGALVTGNFSNGFEVSFSGVSLFIAENTLGVEMTIGTTLTRPNAVKINLEIPPSQAPNGQFADIKEIYVLGKDVDDNEFIMAVGRPENTSLYDNSGQTTLRLTLKLLNSDISDKVVFQFTQATEINSHNQDPNAHQNIRQNLEKAGIFEQTGSHEFIGQSFDEFANGPERFFHASVQTGDLVYLDVDGQYRRALANGGIAERVSGMADLERGAVYANGIVKIQTGYAPSTLLYLHPTNAGQVTDTPSGKPIGQTLDEFNVILRVDSKSQVSDFIDSVVSPLTDFNHYGTLQEAIENTAHGGWIRVDTLQEIKSQSPINFGGKQLNILFTGIQSGVKKFEGLNEIQRISFSSVPDSGDFVLVHDGTETERLSWDSSESEIETSLQALPSITDVTVSGNFSTGFDIEFVGVDGLKGHTQIVAGTNEGINEVQRISFDSENFSSGSFELAFNGEQTSAIPFTEVNSNSIESALLALPNVSSLVVTQDLSVQGTDFLIEFTESDGRKDQNQISVENNSLQDAGTPITGTVSTDIEGELPDNLLTSSGEPVVIIGTTIQEGAEIGTSTAFELDANGIQLVGLGRIQGFETGISLNGKTNTKIEMYFESNVVEIDSTNLSIADFTYAGSVGVRTPEQVILEDTSFRDLVKVSPTFPVSSQVLVSGAQTTLSDGSKHGFIIDQRVSTFSGGDINFSTGKVTNGQDFVPYTSTQPNGYFKYAVMLKPDDTLKVLPPVDDSLNPNTATVPTPKDGILRAIVTVKDNGTGEIEPIRPQDIVRFFDVGAFADQHKIHEFISTGGGSIFDVSTEGTGDTFTFNPDHKILDIDVFVNGVLQTQDREGTLLQDFRKVSNTQIEFADGEGNPYTFPENTKITVKYKENKVDSFRSGVAQASFAVAQRLGDDVTKVFSVTPEIANMQVSPDIHDIEVFVNGQRISQNDDYTKISNTEIELDFALPVNAKMIIQSRDFAVGSGSNGNTISVKDEDNLVTPLLGSLNFKGERVSVLETSSGNAEITIDAEKNDGTNIGNGESVFSGKNGEVFQFRKIKGCDGIGVYLDGDSICISIAQAEYFVAASNELAGQFISLPDGRTYDLGLDRLSVYRNGIKMIQSNSVGDFDERYIEKARGSIELFSSLEFGVDYLHFVNEDVSPNFYLLISGKEGFEINIPNFSFGDGSLRVYRNGVLMTTSGAGGPADRYSEGLGRIILDEPAQLDDFFLIESWPAPAFRQDITNQVGSTVTVPSFSVDDKKLLVFRNGKLLLNGNDFPTVGQPIDRYLETSETEITFEDPLDIDDWVSFIKKA